MSCEGCLGVGCWAVVFFVVGIGLVLQRYGGHIFRLLSWRVRPTIPTTHHTVHAIASKGPAGDESESKFLKRLEAQLKQNEDAQPLIPDTNKCIVWHQGAEYQKTPICVVSFHGWSASRQELNPVPEQIAAALGANLFCVRLSGHGLHKADEGRALAADGLASKLFGDALEAYHVGRCIGHRILLIACSTGGALATWLCAQPSFQPHIAALVMVAPAFALASPVYPYLQFTSASLRLLPPPLARTLHFALARAVLGKTYSFSTKNDEHRKFWTYQYPSLGIAAVLEVLWGVRCGVDLSSICTPTLIFANAKDNTVSFRAIIDMIFEISSKQRVLYNLGHSVHPHVLSGRILSPQTIDEVTRVALDFVNTHGNPAN